MGGHSTEEQRGVLPMIVHNLPMGWCLAAGQAYYELCAKLFWILVQFVGSDTYMSHTIMIQDKLWDEIFPRLVLVLVLFISGLLPFWGNNRIGAICHRVKIASFKIAAKMESAKMCFALILSFLQTLLHGGQRVWQSMPGPFHKVWATHQLTIWCWFRQKSKPTAIDHNLMPKQ